MSPQLTFAALAAAAYLAIVGDVLYAFAIVFALIGVYVLEATS